MKSFILYLIIINATTFLLMLVDKQKARKKQWRIPEATFFGCALFGGSIGCILGMYTVRHKTKKPLFYIGMPIIVLFQGIILFFLLA